MILWDVQARKAIKAVEGAHTHPVIRVAFLDDCMRLLSVDVAGAYCVCSYMR